MQRVSAETFPNGTRCEVWQKETAEPNDTSGWKGPIIITNNKAASNRVEFKWELTGKEDHASPHLIRLFEDSIYFYYHS